MIATKIYERLSQLSDNVYLGHAPLDYSTPAVTFNHVSSELLDDLDNDEDGAFVLIQVAVYDPIYLTAEALALAIKNDLKANIENDFVVTWTDFFSDVDKTTQVDLHRIVMRFRVFTQM